MRFAHVIFSVKSAIFLYNMHIVFAVMLLLFTCFVVMLSLIMNYIDKLEDNHSSSSYSEVQHK